MPLALEAQRLNLRAGPAQEGEQPLSLHHLTTAFFFFFIFYLFVYSF